MKKPSLLAALMLLSACNAAEEDLQAEAKSTASAELKDSVRLLVGFKGTPGAAERAMLRGQGATIRRELAELKVIAIEVPAARAEALARAQGVEYVEEDLLRKPQALANAQLVPSLSNGLYGLVSTRSTDTHARGVIGTGIRIGIADTGLDYTHPDIAPVYKGGIDTVSDDMDPWWNGDVNETHGTHVAGTIVGANNTSGVLGVAYGAELYHARVLGPSGGYSSDIMAGVRYLVETAGCRVVNMSLGGGTKSRTEETFYNEMRTKGALIVAATGNDSATRVSYPAAYTSNIGVGAVDVNNAHASFSNSGTGIDVSGPGVLVLSSVPAGQGSEAEVTSGAGAARAFGLTFASKTSGLSRTLVNCGLGNVGECPASVSGNIALIQRGTLSFSDKVLNAMNQGAVGAILYNNAAGDFMGTLTTETTSAGKAWIPAVSVSDTAGAALKAQVGSTVSLLNQVAAYDHYDGTSMATPHVTGVVALIWSSNPTLSNSQVESYLTSTAKDLGTAGFDSIFGYGLVDASAAVKAASGK
ncbi:S8 family serine peptidase [Cystobacter fuscus]|uniref:S8 family serine peptidase n=1 Tax=Cystobacter fuscus TaxID=43 RepID=UPI002B290A0C|nr:S8 family serine peptidase [Cystobacter fuscus]